MMKKALLLVFGLLAPSGEFMARVATNSGHLEVICGSMFSGKSEELIRRVRRAQYAQSKIAVFKHRFDDRKLIDYIVSHNGNQVEAHATDNPEYILQNVGDDIDIVAIDEVQFFPIEIVSVIFELLHRGKRVIIAGLDLDFRGVPFGCMPPLLALADEVEKLKAICVICGGNAHFSQRLIDGEPAKFNDPVVKIGAEECYQARCRECYRINQRPTREIYGQI